MQDVMKKIYEFSLEEIMGDRFKRYSKAIIQDRALPDVRDGLKPVQRRILYSMYRAKNTYDKPTRKSAKSVGEIMGNYHPHGDSSIYEAIVRMSQWWKLNTPFIDMQGNNGSMDGDSAAAMRYTEARLSKISNEFLRDIDKDTVIWTRNYDDSLFEPTVLPVRFPNLLVNGSTGISAGYATNIPPHNLSEIVDVTVKMIKKPSLSLDEAMEIVKGPDFPTGGIVEGKKDIYDAFKTGKGKVVLKSKVEFVKSKGKDQIFVSEIPYEVNKQALVKKINDIKIDKKIDGILDVRDESDRNGLSIVIDLKKEANKELVLNYLLKNTELQINYSYNMVAIVNSRPMTLGILDIIKAFIDHQKEFVEKRTNFDLAVARKQHHKTIGLIKALSILDEVIATIKASKNKADSIENLVKEYEFSYEQADAIVTLQLYRLTNFDVLELKEENQKLELIMQGLEKILSDPEELKKLMIKELLDIKKEYGVERKTEIKEEVTEIKIENTQIIPKEDVVVVVTNEGYIKRVSLRSYNAEEETALKELDFVIGKYNMNTQDTLLLFTDLGNYLYVPVYEIPDLKWKELGKHISNLIKIEPEENIIKSIPVYNFEDNSLVTMFTKDGLVKRTNISEYKAVRYSKPIAAIKLKKNDLVVDVTCSSGEFVLVTTHLGYGLKYKVDEIPITGIKTAGVKAISLKNDFVVSGHVYLDSDEFLVVTTKKNTAKRIKLSEFETISRARKGVQIIRDVKTNPYYILKTLIASGKQKYGFKTKSDVDLIKITEIPISDRYSTGTAISKEDILDCFLETNVEENNVEVKKVQNLEEIDNKMLTIDDFLDDFKLE
ncbi:MAG: DNA topoisomerase IV subunit A [Bacilli bacterium]|nr:DNA topoisomerase IV subunit A [Bacilli bacterium]